MADDGEVTRVPPERKRGGVWVTFGEEAYRVPPLALDDIQELQQQFEAVMTGVAASIPTGDRLKAVQEIVHAALARNYPSMTLEVVRDMIDLGNYAEAMNAVFSVSGFQRKAGTPAPGETAASSTGMPSTLPSSTPSDGPGST
jgi:hypothetical protein